jgi:hypothetical protein
VQVDENTWRLGTSSKYQISTEGRRNPQGIRLDFEAQPEASISKTAPRVKE